MLLQGSLTKVIEGDAARKLLTRLDQALSAMSGMLNALLDINQIEAGTVRAEMVDFPINDLFDRMQEEFSYHAKAKGHRSARGPMRRHSAQRHPSAGTDAA